LRVRVQNPNPFSLLGFFLYYFDVPVVKRKILDLRNLEYPKFLSLLSYSVRNSPGIVEALIKPQQLEPIVKWSSESGNKILEKATEKVVLQRGKGFHGVCLNEKLSFYLTGIKLHTKEFLLRLFNKHPDYLINFISIPEGIRGIELAKNLGFHFEVLPSPKEVERYCGFALGFKDLKEAENCFLSLLEKKIGVETVFKRNKSGYRFIKKAWEV
jgi:hypothetical protein